MRIVSSHGKPGDCGMTSVICFAIVGKNNLVYPGPAFVLPPRAKGKHQLFEESLTIVTPSDRCLSHVKMYHGRPSPRIK